MSMATILLNDSEPFEQSVNSPSTKCPWNLIKMCQVVSEKNTFKDFMVLYLYITQGQGRITPRGQNCDPYLNVLLI